MKVARVMAVAILLSMPLPPAVQAGETYQGIKHNEYLYPQPMDDTVVKGKMVVWKGVFEKHDGKYVVVRWNSRKHPYVFWAFTNPKGLDLTQAPRYVQVMGKYQGTDMVSTTFGLRRVGVIEAVEVAKSTWDR